MSTYIHKNTTDGIYSYDFQVAGKRFYGSTGKTTKRAAEVEEQRLRDEAKAALKAANQAMVVTGGGRRKMTMLEATDRLWQEVGQHVAADNQNTFMLSMAWLVGFFGKDTPLSEIDDARIAQAVAKRRGEYNQKMTKGMPRQVSR